jgi:hypothetical protein
MHSFILPSFPSFLRFLPSSHSFSFLFLFVIYFLLLCSFLLLFPPLYNYVSVLLHSISLSLYNYVSVLLYVIYLSLYNYVSVLLHIISLSLFLPSWLN